MVISKRRHYCNFLFAMVVMGILIFGGMPVLNHYLFHLSVVDKICRYGLLAEVVAVAVCGMFVILSNKGFKNYISKNILLRSIEENLIAVGAYTKPDGKVYVELPKIKIRQNTIKINLANLKIRREIYIGTGY